MKLGFFSPLPPSPSGVADYSAALLRAMRALGPVRINQPGDIDLYHIGNNQLHRPIYERALARPGIVVLHDAVLQHFFLGSLDREAYIHEFVHNYGEWSRDFAGDLWHNRARSAADRRYFDYPMLKRIAETSRAVIVHNPAARRIVTRHAPAARVVEIPHLFDPPRGQSVVDALRFRAQLGLKPRTLVVSVFGHLREAKRLPIVLRAMRQAWDAGAGAVLLVAGEFVSRDLERAVAPLLRDPRILRTGHLPEPDFWRFAAITDVCVNLRHPAAGETSGIAIRLMGIGKAVACTTGDEIDRIPETACLRIDPGVAEQEMLSNMIRWLARERQCAEEIGRRAARHIAAHHAPESVAQKFWDEIRVHS